MRVIFIFFLVCSIITGCVIPRDTKRVIIEGEKYKVEERGRYYKVRKL